MAKGSVNKVIVLGRLGQDPEVKTTQTGTKIVNLSIATTELGRKDQATGQRGPDQTEWHRVVLFGFLADNAATYLRKGSQVYLEGRLQTRKWQDQNGADRWSTEIVGNEMQFMGGGQGAQGAQPQQGGYQQQPVAPQQAPQQGGYQQPAPQAPAPQHAQAPAQNYNQAPAQRAPQQAAPQQAPQQQAPAQNYNQAPAQPKPAAPQPAQSAGFDDFDDDIPF